MPPTGRAGAGALGAPPLPPSIRAVLLLAVVNYAVLVVVYVMIDDLFDFVEPGLISVSWLVAEGLPTYVEPNSSAQYSVMYGPVLFLLNALVFKVVGPSLMAGKFAAGLFALGSVGHVYAAGRTDFGPRAGLIGAGALALIYFIFWPFATFIARADALILGFVAVGLWGGTLRNALATTVIVGVAAGLAANVKAHSAVYFLPIAILLWQRHGLRWAIAAGAISLLALIAPFLFYPTVSLAAYLETLERAVQHGLAWKSFLLRLQQLLLFLGLPTLMVLLVVDRPLEQMIAWRWFLAAMGCTVVATLIVSSHAGSTKIFLAPIAVPLAYWLAGLVDGGFAWGALRDRLDWGSWWRRWVSLGLFVIAVLTAVPVNLHMYRLMHQEVQANAILADLGTVMRGHPDHTIAMGYGSTEQNYFTRFRPMLVFAGNPYLVDESSMLDLQAVGRDLPDATFDALKSCQIGIWLVPRGNPPFSLSSAQTGGRLFSDRFRETFVAQYEPREASRYYDLWFCKRG